jgi:hypothetical protein
MNSLLRTFVKHRNLEKCYHNWIHAHAITGAVIGGSMACYASVTENVNILAATPCMITGALFGALIGFFPPATPIILISFGKEILKK